MRSWLWPAPLDHKAFLIEAAPEIFFDDAHYEGYPAVLVRLDFVSSQELARLLKAAHSLKTTKIRKRRR